MLKHSDPFIQMTINSLAGAVIGMMVGLILGLIIQKLEGYISPIEGEGPAMISSFLGMGFGTVIGSILGGIVGIKK